MLKKIEIIKNDGSDILELRGELTIYSVKELWDYFTVEITSTDKFRSIDLSGISPPTIILENTQIKYK